MIKLLLVDDQISVRYGLRLRLGLEPDMVIVGEASDGATALALFTTLQPDVVLMDVELPGLDGLAATAKLRAVAPECRVVILSLHDDPETQQRAQQVGAAAFVSKQAADRVLLAAIRQAADRSAGM